MSLLQQPGLGEAVSVGWNETRESCMSCVVSPDSCYVYVYVYVYVCVVSPDCWSCLPLSEPCKKIVSKI